MVNLQETKGFMSRLQPSATLAVSSRAKEMRAAGLDVCSMSAGEPDFDTPQHIKNAAIEAINNGMTKYTPASGTLELKKAVCDKLKEENGLKNRPFSTINFNSQLSTKFGLYIVHKNQILYILFFFINSEGVNPVFSLKRRQK